MFEINVGKSRIRHKNDSEFEFSIDFESIEKFIIQFQCRVYRIRLFPTLISKIKWLWSELPLRWVKGQKSIRTDKVLTLLNSMTLTWYRNPGFAQIKIGARLFIKINIIDENHSNCISQISINSIIKMVGDPITYLSIAK